ncbi:MAG: protoglobin domain-containing protein [Steroidobacteraceae bacterium]|nr:protoglobin domain-containing protein [Steroidobacteraceae bacterium]
MTAQSSLAAETAARTAAIPGYTLGQPAVARAPMTLEELDLLKRTLLLGDEDLAALRASAPILEPQAEAILDVWYGFVASQPQLVQYFGNARTGAPDAAYLAAVRHRFRQWILDTANARYDQRWLDYQFEIGRRHHRFGKNRTDAVESVPHIAYRYVPALLYPVTATLKPFLAKGGASPEQVEAMHQAWVKSVLLQVILWSHPYVKDGDF